MLLQDFQVSTATHHISEKVSGPVHVCLHVGAVVPRGMASDFRSTSGQILVCHLQYSSQPSAGFNCCQLRTFWGTQNAALLGFPNFKANFSISIQAPASLVALSTMAEESSQPGLEPGTMLHKFGVTPKMSTYLIGVTVGHMVSSSAMSDSGRKISVWSVPALGHQHAVPLQVILPCLSVCAHVCPQWNAYYHLCCMRLSHVSCCGTFATDVP